MLASEEVALDSLVKLIRGGESQQNVSNVSNDPVRAVLQESVSQTADQEKPLDEQKEQHQNTMDETKGDNIR